MKITGLSINCMEYQQDFWMSSASANQIYNKRFCILVRIMTDEGPPPVWSLYWKKNLGPA